MREVAKQRVHLCSPTSPDLIRFEHRQEIEHPGGREHPRPIVPSRMGNVRPRGLNPMREKIKSPRTKVGKKSKPVKQVRVAPCEDSAPHGECNISQSSDAEK